MPEPRTSDETVELREDSDDEMPRQENRRASPYNDWQISEDGPEDINAYLTRRVAQISIEEINPEALGLDPVPAVARATNIDPVLERIWRTGRHTNIRFVQVPAPPVVVEPPPEGPMMLPEERRRMVREHLKTELPRWISHRGLENPLQPALFSRDEINYPAALITDFAEWYLAQHMDDWYLNRDRMEPPRNEAFIMIRQAPRDEHGDLSWSDARGIIGGIIENARKDSFDAFLGTPAGRRTMTNIDGGFEAGAGHSTYDFEFQRWISWNIQQCVGIFPAQSFDEYRASRTVQI